MTDFKDIEFELYGNLIQMKNILSYYNVEDEIIGDLAECSELIKSKKYHVAVVGEFRRGKSSLINAILGLKVLPADVTPTTATINRITFGTEPEVNIYYKDGRKETVAIEELQNYVTKLNSDLEQKALSIREAVVSYPTVICQNHVDIIDTPGLNDDEAMTDATLGLLQNIDAVIVAVSALSPFSEVEKHFVADLISRETISDIIFVVTFIDQVDDEDLPRLLDNIRQRIQQMTLEEIRQKFGNQKEITAKAERILLSHFKLFAVSSQQALQSFITGNRKLLKSSRFPFFKEELFKILTAQQSIHVVERVSATIYKASQSFDRIYQEKFDIIESRIGKLQEAISILKDYFNKKDSLWNNLCKKQENALNEILKSVDDSQWGLKSLFIENLYLVRENEASQIVSALQKGAEQSLAKAERLTNKLQEKMQKLFKDLQESMLAHRKCFYDNVQPLVVQEAVFSAQEQLEGQIDERLTRLQTIQFRFDGDIIPQVPKIEHYNIIVSLEQVIRRSFEALRSQCRDYQKKALACLKEEFFQDDALRQQSETSLKAQLDSAQKELLVCQGNYELHRSMIQGLVESTEYFRTQCGGQENENPDLPAVREEKAEEMTER